MMNTKLVSPRGATPKTLVTRLRAALGCGLASTALLAGMPVQVAAQPRSAADMLLEEVVVTARKREETLTDVPLSVSAFNSDQLDALKVRELTSFAVGMPNVALDQVGTTRGTANFSIRGLGINSSIPSIDPTVGVIVNGVYLGVINGIIFDIFDLESIQVLRGPQGTLFGRNVTGGAVLLETRRPSDEFELRAKAAVDRGWDEGDGLNRYLMGSVSGPLSDAFAARLTYYMNKDDGWFENQFDGDDFGEADTWAVRPSLLWTPTEDLSVLVRYEHMEIEGDGPAAQCHTNGSGIPCSQVDFDRDSFDMSVNEKGSQDTESDFLSIQMDWHVGFGDGTVTNIFGWRNADGVSTSDIDAQPISGFHADAWLEAEQYSYELRYNGLFAERWNVTVGGMWFTNDILYHERRRLTPAPLLFDGGGDYQVDSWNVFAAIDYDLTDLLTLTAGFNYSSEEKDARVASLSRNNPILRPGFRGCNIVENGDCPFDFEDDESWDNFAPKLGMNYQWNDDTSVYAHWSRAFRSGGYNLRNTSFNPLDTPGPFDEEEVNNYEVGLKTAFAGRGRFNAAVFYNEITDMQREINKPGPVGVIQLIRNTADAEIWGIEADTTFALTENIVLIGSIGWLDASYEKVAIDLNEDGVIDSRDKGLDLPRAADLTWSIGINADWDVGSLGYVSSRLSYAYRDESAYTDSNLGYILDQEILDAGIDFHTSDGRWTVGLYGKNLLNDVKHGGDTQLPRTIGGIPAGGTFSPLDKGRVYGIEVTFSL